MTIIFHWSGIDPSYETTKLFAGKGWLLVTFQGWQAFIVLIFVTAAEKAFLNYINTFNVCFSTERQ